LAYCQLTHAILVLLKALKRGSWYSKLNYMTVLLILHILFKHRWLIIHLVAVLYVVIHLVFYIINIVYWLAHDIRVEKHFGVYAGHQRICKDQKVCNQNQLGCHIHIYIVLFWLILLNVVFYRVVLSILEFIYFACNRVFKLIVLFVRLVCHVHWRWEHPVYYLGDKNKQPVNSYKGVLYFTKTYVLLSLLYLN